MWIWISLIILIILAGLFAAAEMSIFSARRERMKQAVTSGDKRGEIVLGFLKNPTEVLTALQLGTTIIAITMGAITDAHYRAPLQSWIEGFGIANVTAGQLAFGTVVLTTSIVSIIFAGAIPKKIAWIHADQVAIGSAPIVNLWRIGTVPIVATLIRVSDAISHLVGIRTPHDDDVTETDLKVLVETGIQGGLIDPNESRIVMNAFRLSDRKVSEIMTGAESLQTVDIEQEWTEVEKTISDCPRSIFLVSQSGEIIGSLKARDAFVAKADFRKFVHPIVSIESCASLLELFQLFEDWDTRVVLVKDQDSVVGLVTLHDLVAVTLGSLANLKDAGEPEPATK